MTSVVIAMSGSAAGDQAVRNVASRKAFAATWCASMMPHTVIAIGVRLRFTERRPRGQSV